MSRHLFEKYKVLIKCYQGESEEWRLIVKSAEFPKIIVRIQHIPAKISH